LCGGAGYFAISETLIVRGAGSAALDAGEDDAHSSCMSGQRPVSPPSEPVTDLRIIRAMRAVQAEPARRFSVRELAKLAGASRASFARLFQRATGMSPQRWLTAQRLERAAQLLHNSDATLAEIAVQVGYVSEFAFSRAFKRRHGVAPARYRQELSGAPLRCAA
jgi:transcriptional regulator GlxA family with amidase domain